MVLECHVCPRTRGHTGDADLRGDMVFKKFSETTEPKRSTHGKGVYEPHGADWETSTLYVNEIFPRKYPKNLFWVPATPKQHFHTPQRLAAASTTTGMVAAVAPGHGAHGDQGEVVGVAGLDRDLLAIDGDHLQNDLRRKGRGARRGRQ